MKDCGHSRRAAAGSEDPVDKKLPEGLECMTGAW